MLEGAVGVVPRVANTRLAVKVKRRVAYPAVKNTALECWMEGAVGVMRQVANTRLAVKRRIAYPAVMNTTPRGRILDGKGRRRIAYPAVMSKGPRATRRLRVNKLHEGYGCVILHCRVFSTCSDLILVTQKQTSAGEEEEKKKKKKNLSNRSSLLVEYT